MSSYLLNPSYRTAPDFTGSGFEYLQAIGTVQPPESPGEAGGRWAGEVLAFHRSLAGYAPTPLRRMPATAQALGVGELLVKDESERFGLPSFKPLGSSFAVYRLLKRLCRERFSAELTPRDLAGTELLRKLGALTLSAATDGNHGRAVAWFARRLGERAVIYMPAKSAAARVEQVRAEGAQVVLVDGSFDDCVARCSADSRTQGWQVVADTGYPGYLEVPRDIMLGYTTLFAETDAQLAEQQASSQRSGKPGVDFLLLQTGVGGLAAAGIAYYALRYGSARPLPICIEPASADGLFASLRAGCPAASKGSLDSVMAGLNCGIPSLSAWPILRIGARACVAIEDEWALRAMRAYAHEGIVSGESGAAGLAGLLAMAFDRPLRRLRTRLGLGPKSRVLLINTEGDTDPASYRKAVELDAAAVRGRPAR